MLQVKGINTYYGAAHVLQKVTLEVKRGEAVALLGRNGMGKTNYPALYYGTDTGQERLDPLCRAKKSASCTLRHRKAGGELHPG